MATSDTCGLAGAQTRTQSCDLSFCVKKKIFESSLGDEGGGMSVCVCVECVLWCVGDCDLVKLVNQFEELCSLDGLCPEVGGCEVSWSFGSVEEVCGGVSGMAAEMDR